jgi:hypothetical protein
LIGSPYLLISFIFIHIFLLYPILLVIYSKIQKTFEDFHTLQMSFVDKQKGQIKALHT